MCERDSCDLSQCLDRHPKLCNFYSVYGRCKFSPCAYKHVDKVDGMKIKEFEVKLLEKEKELNDLKIKMGFMIDRLDEIEKSAKENKDKLEKLLVENNPTTTNDSDQATIIPSQSEVADSSTSMENALIAKISTYAADFAKPEYLDYRYEPECCQHRHIPGRGGHNVPRDGSQCCYHKCRANPHFLAVKPGG